VAFLFKILKCSQLWPYGLSRPKTPTIMHHYPLFYVLNIELLNYIELSLLLLSIIWKLRTYLLIIISLSVLSSTKVFSNHYYFFKQNCKLRFLNLSLSFYLPRELHHFWQMSNMPNMLHISTLNLFSYFNRMFLIVLDDIISYVLHTDSKCLIKNIRLPFCCIFHFS
jgi:hypothetical protein